MLCEIYNNYFVIIKKHFSKIHYLNENRCGGREENNVSADSITISQDWDMRVEEQSSSVANILATESSHSRDRSVAGVT